MINEFNKHVKQKCETKREMERDNNLVKSVMKR